MGIIAASLFRLCQGGLCLSVFVQGHGQIDAESHMVGRYLHRILCSRNRFGQLTQATQGQTQIIQHRRPIAMDGQSLTETFCRLLVLTLIQQERAQPGIGFGMMGMLIQHRPQMGKGLVNLSGILQRPRQSQTRCCLIGG